MRDVANYRSFLLSPIGGLWHQSEIVHMDRPSAAEVHRSAAGWRAHDYVVIIFCGHGCVKGDSTWAELREGQEIDSIDLRQETVGICTSSLRVVTGRFADRTGVHYRRQSSRWMVGAVFLATFLSSVLMETVGTLRRPRFGTAYALIVVQASRAWAGDSTTDTSRQYGILPVVDAHDEAGVLVRRVRPQQNPQIEKARTGPILSLLHCRLMAADI
jgi:hypothetical protein